MKKVILISLIAISLWCVGRLLHVGQVIMLFITVGVIPGTNTSLSPDSMLMLLGGIAAIVIASIIFRHTFQYLITRYYVVRFYRQHIAHLHELRMRLDRWYHSVQSLPTKAATPEE